MVDPEHARTYGGTGRFKNRENLVELMSGDITVESKVGEGTRITIALPMETTEAVGHCEPQTDPKQVLGGKTLWVVDDMRANHLVVEQMAARYGAIRSFESGEALLSQADTELDADVMLLDYNMPSMTGHELFCNQISISSSVSLFCYDRVIILRAQSRSKRRLMEC